jgi:ubiquinone/menaquinone biosynthesis C-methylase UbiE
MKRDFDPATFEMMDRPQAVTPELESDLENLRRLNQYFGSYGLLRHFLRLWLTPDRNWSILDLATGSADIPCMIADWARQRKIGVRIDAVDFHESTLEIARRRVAGYPEISLIRADARTYSCAQTYDLVCCSLALHHFSDDDAVKLLRQMRRLTHDKALVADLERSWFAWIAVWFLTTLVFREPMTQYDARLSVKRAFTCREFRSLAAAAGWENFSHRRFMPVRQAAWFSIRELQPVLMYAMPSPTCTA